MNKNVKTMAALVAAFLMTGAAASAIASDGANSGSGKGQTTEVRLRTKLTGAAIGTMTPEGSADFRVDQKGRARLNVEVEHVNLPAGTVLTVSVQHGTTITVVGTITLKALGGAELDLDSQDGDVVPTIVSGDMISVANGTAAVVAGVF